MSFGFLVGSRNFIRLFWIYWVVSVLQVYDCNHCVAKSCSTTAYRWLCRDPLLSLRTLWSSKFSALGTTVPARLQQEALVVFVHYAYPNPVPLLLAAPEVIHEKNWKCLDVLEHFHLPAHTGTPVPIQAPLATHHSAILRRRHFYLGFRFQLIYATGPLVLMIPRSFTSSCRWYFRVSHSFLR